MIVDLSFSHNHSINDGIPITLCSLSYSSVDSAVSEIVKMGKGTGLIKINRKDAYRIVPLHPRNMYLLAITWQNVTYLDCALLRGLTSAPKIFSAVVADMIAWALHCCELPQQFHYLNDFLLFVHSSEQNGAGMLVNARQTLNVLGVPVTTQVQGSIYKPYLSWNRP
uniref:Reverse transcriptase domain-containing protein n=1 Tax=Amphimedon queenslandica TaxID=400682 RepID=A0A1X7TMC5_AMPQE